MPSANFKDVHSEDVLLQPLLISSNMYCLANMAPKQIYDIDCIDR